MNTPKSKRKTEPAAPYHGQDFSAAPAHGLSLVVSPAGWRVWRRGVRLASGPETGAAGWARAWEAAGMR